MKKPLTLYRFLCLCGIALATPCYSAQETDDADLGGFIDAPEWQEEAVTIPPFPDADDLLKVEIDRVDKPFTYYLDSKNIQSSQDGVIRYSIVIESNSGARNVLFEGLRCLTAEYRTYAYGTSDKSFVKARTSQWAGIESTGSMVHRYDFFRHYMCSIEQTTYPVETILRRVRYPDDFQDGGETSD